MRPNRRRQVRTRRIVLVAVLGLLVATVADAATGVRREAVRVWSDVVGTSRPTATSDRVVIVFAARPAALRDGTFGSRAAVDAATAAQDRTLARLAARGFHLQIEQRFVRATNAVVAVVRGDERARLASDRSVSGLFGIRSIVPAGVAESTLPLLGDAVRPVVSGVAGEGAGMTIAVLDGPVDENHTLLAGRVDRPAGASEAPADATAEHGTAVAALAAGAGGPAGLRGTAPGARILAVRVLTADDQGRLTGTTAELLAGLEIVADPNGDGDLADRARVALAAVSAPFAGFGDSAEARAITALDAIGVVVVAPAGNDGPTGGRVGSLSSPGAARDALTVGAADGRAALPQVEVAITGATAEAPFVAPLAGALAPPAGQNLAVRGVATSARAVADAGAFASDYQGPDGASRVAGAAVLVPRDGGDLRLKARTAAAAGAAVVLVYGPGGMPAGALGIDDRVPVPVVALDGSLGVRLAQAVAAGQPVTVTFGAAAYHGNGERDAVAPFSSEGLGFDDALKPDLVLPGVAIVSALAGGGYAAVSGTSVAAAQAAGMVAALTSAHPDWSAQRIRSALVSTAALVRGLGSPLAPVQAQGGGRPDAVRAATTVLSTTPLSLALGAADAGGTARGVLTIANNGDLPQTVAVGLQRDGAGDEVGLAVTADPPRFVLGPRAAVTLPVVVTLRPPAGQNGVAGGWLVVTPDGGQPQRVPLVVAFGGAGASPIGEAVLSPDAVIGADEIAQLAVVLGEASAGPDGAMRLVAVRNLTIDVYRGARRVARVYAARDLLPGRYRFALRARGRAGAPLRPGRYAVVVRAIGSDGSVGRRVLRLRVR